MTTIELARLVAEMRIAQRKYFRTRAPGDLERSKALERRADAAVEAVLRQPTLIWGDDHGAS